MPRSTKTVRIIAEATIETNQVPDSNGDMVTVAVTVPTRGFIHRVSLVWGKSSAHSGDINAGGIYLHTACAAGAGAGTTRLTSADAQTIFAQALMNPDYGNLGGGQAAVGSSVYVWAQALDFAPGMKNTSSTSGASGGGPFGAYYDASGDTLGPTQGTGTIFLTWIAGAGNDMQTNTIFCKARFEIEPCP